MSNPDICEGKSLQNYVPAMQIQRVFYHYLNFYSYSHVCLKKIIKNITDIVIYLKKHLVENRILTIARRALSYHFLFYFESTALTVKVNNI